MILTRKIALTVAGVVTAGVLGTAGVAAATAGDGRPATALAAPGTATPGTGSTAAPDAAAKDRAKKAKHALRARGMHGEWVVKGKDGTPVTLVSVRGSVTAVGPTRVTVKAEDGYTATFTATKDTKVRGADVDAISDVKVGAQGAVVGVKDGNTLTARAVLVRK
jgi:hypothetical protein